MTPVRPDGHDQRVVVIRAFLASATYITAEVIDLNGGYLIA
jgi:hypothetical protein